MAVMSFYTDDFKVLFIEVTHYGFKPIYALIMQPRNNRLKIVETMNYQQHFMAKSIVFFFIYCN